MDEKHFMRTVAAALKQDSRTEHRHRPIPTLKQ